MNIICYQMQDQAGQYVNASRPRYTIFSGKGQLNGRIPRLNSEVNQLPGGKLCSQTPALRGLLPWKASSGQQHAAALYQAGLQSEFF